MAGKYPAKLASYVDDLGAMLEGTAKNKIFTLDGGGGTAIFGQGKPYFWGTRAITPNDPMPGLFKWYEGELPRHEDGRPHRLGHRRAEQQHIKADILKKIADGGLHPQRSLRAHSRSAGRTSRAVFPKIKANEPDILLFGIYGQDPGSFANQADDRRI